MKNKNYINLIMMVIIFLSITTSLSGISSRGKHFTFKIPVTIYNNNNCIDSVKVVVIVSSKEPLSAMDMNIIGRGEWTYSMTGRRDLATTATISFNAKVSKFPKDAKTWIVNWFIRKTGARGYTSLSSLNTDNPTNKCIIDITKPIRRFIQGRISP